MATTQTAFTIAGELERVLAWGLPEPNTPKSACALQPDRGRAPSRSSRTAIGDPVPLCNEPDVESFRGGYTLCAGAL